MVKVDPNLLPHAESALIFQTDLPENILYKGDESLATGLLVLSIWF
jgi:hypothetical protein